MKHSPLIVSLRRLEPVLDRTSVVVDPTAWRPPGRGTPSPRADDAPALATVTHPTPPSSSARHSRSRASSTCVGTWRIGTDRPLHFTSLRFAPHPPLHHGATPVPTDVERGSVRSRNDRRADCGGRVPASRWRSLPAPPARPWVSRPITGLPRRSPHRQSSVTARRHRQCDCGPVSGEPGYSPRSSVRTF
jgi:hypothetical protein